MANDPAALSAPATPFRDAFTHGNGLPAAPLVLGFAGHRDLPKDPGVMATFRQALEHLFRQIREAYPYSPLVLLTSLAEGADQLAAEVALANGVFVRVSLPFPAEAFRESTSFSTAHKAETQANFDRILNDPRVESFVVPLPPGTLPEGIDWMRIAADQTDPANADLRRVCYANAGGYIVTHCHALVAMWDGKPADPVRPSGTAEHVSFKLEGKPLVKYPWTVHEPLGFHGERGLVYVIHTPRGAESAADKRSGAVEILVPIKHQPSASLPDGTALARKISPGHRMANELGGLFIGCWQWTARGIRSLFGSKPDVPPEAWAELLQFQETCQAVDDFNRDVLTLTDVPVLRQSLQATEASVPDDLKTPSTPALWIQRVSAVGHAASHLSGRLRPRLEWGLVAVFVLLGFSVATFHFYSHFFELVESEGVHNPIWLFLSLAALAGAAVLVFCVRWRRTDERRLDYRALAEGLRVRRSWALAGIGASVADSYLGQMRGEMSWARRALKHCCPPPATWSEAFAELAPPEAKHRLEFVMKDWVEGQAEHFKDRHAREEHRAKWFRRIGWGLALIGWFWFPAVIAREVMHMLRAPAAEASDPVHATVHSGLVHPKHGWLVGAGLCIIVGGLVIAYREKRAHEELAHQFERMHVVFDNGKKELQRRLEANDLIGARAVLAALGHEAITEHVQWLILMRARPPELPIG